MITPVAVEELLKRNAVAYALVRPQAPESIPRERLVKALLFATKSGPVLALLPADQTIDREALSTHLGSSLAPLSAAEQLRVCAQYASGLLPIVGAQLPVQTAIETTLLQADEIYIDAGDAAYVRLSREDFCALNRSADYVHFAAGATKTQPLSRTLHNLSARDIEGDYMPVFDIRRKIELLTELPAMPDMAHKLLRLQANPDAEIRDLSKLIALDPSLAAQVLRLSRSAYYGYRGVVKTVDDAIVRVLGFDVTFNMALGLAISKQFRVPREGELGLYAYWQHALHSAAITHILVRMMPASARPKAGVAYLCGLLHNLGLLAFGHLFPKEFQVLRKVAAAHPQIPLVDVERHVLGVTHADVGGWLMRAWNMPEEITAATAAHHQATYTGEHAVFVALVQTSDRLLRRYDIGEADGADVPPEALAFLQLEEDEVREAVETLVGGAELNAMAHQLAA